MKKVLISISLCLIVVLAFANSRAAQPPKCDCTCPSLDTLIKEKEAADRESQAELGRLRRQTFKDKFSHWPLP